MLDHALTTRTARLVILVTAIATLTGCAQTRGWLDGLRKSPRSSASPVILGAPEANTYLTELQALAAGDPATQAEIFADARSAATLTPGPQNDLRFALVLATPGHAESDPERAQSLLRELMSRHELMTVAEIALATIYLNSVEDRIVHDADLRRLRESNSRAARTQQEAVNQRIAAVEAENRRLRRELTDAQEKLEAIMNIERSIREREN